MATSAPLWLVAMAAVAFSFSQTALASALPMKGYWRPVQPGDTPAQVLAQARQGTLIRFEPATMHAFVGHGDGAWVVLLPQPPWSESEHRVLSLRSMPFETVTLYGPDGPLYDASMTLDDTGLRGYDRVALPLPATWPGSAPILLRFHPGPSINEPVSMRLTTRAQFQHDTTAWLTLASGSFGVMLAMGAMALCFALMLRDATFAWYAGYIGAYAVVQMVQTGFFIEPLNWIWMQDSTRLVDSIALALALIFAGMFMLRFCDLRQRAPVMHMLVVGLIGYTALTALARSTHVAALVNLAHAMINPLLMLSAGVMLIAALTTAGRGSRSSWFFLAGWAPLLIVTALASAQVSGALPDLIWLNDSGIPVAALESVILSFGLADRALTIRRDRDHARELADRDSLTGVLNRRAWIEEVQIRLAGARRHPQALLFMDLDNFKMLNDHLGHASGDRALVNVAEALRVELRPVDVLGRYGGEEFVVLLDGTSPQDAMHIATRLRRRIHRLEIPISKDGQQLTVSIGVSFARPEDSIGEIVERADEAMYTAKAGGRNKVVSEAHIMRSRRRDGDVGNLPPPAATRAPDILPTPVWRARASNGEPLQHDDDID